MTRRPASGCTSTNADAKAKGAPASRPTEIAIVYPGRTSSVKIPGVPAACSAMNPLIDRNARDSRRHRASPRRRAPSPATSERLAAVAPTPRKKKKCRVGACQWRAANCWFSRTARPISGRARASPTAATASGPRL
jgi:hypothetical protein